jgi:hypothetical protein
MGYSSVATSTVSVVHPQIPATIEWDKFDGGDLSHSNQRFYTAPNKEQVFGGKSARDNVTVEAFLDPVAYADFIEAGNAGEKFAGAVIRVQSVDAAGIPVGKADEYKACVVSKWTPRKVDLNGEDMQKIIIEWEVPSP